MSRLPRRLSGLVLGFGLAVVSANAEAVVKHRHPPHRHGVVASSREPSFPVYIDRGSDRNPGGDDLYFSDTKVPHYIVGPAWFQRWE